MEVPLQVAFRNMDRSDAVEARVRDEVDKLERFHDRMTSCRVVVVAPHRHGNKGRLYQVNIDIELPGRQSVIVKRAKPNSHAHEDVYVAIRDAFAAATRQLQEKARIKRDAVKTHEEPPHGEVVRLFEYEGYGFIRTHDGLEVYFHRNAVVDSRFEDLEVGAQVRLSVAENESAEGPQASTVRTIGKHHIAGPKL